MSKEDYSSKVDKIIKEVDGKWVVDEQEAIKLLHSSDPKDYDKPSSSKVITGCSVKINTKRYTAFPDRLPADKLPHPPDEHELMGMFETNRDLYLMLANDYNKIMERIEALESKIDNI